MELIESEWNEEDMEAWLTSDVEQVQQSNKKDDNNESDRETDNSTRTGADLKNELIFIDPTTVESESDPAATEADSPVNEVFNSMIQLHIAGDLKFEFTMAGRDGFAGSSYSVKRSLTCAFIVRKQLNKAVKAVEDWHESDAFILEADAVE
jgi:hypothetical protein